MKPLTEDEWYIVRHLWDLDQRMEFEERAGIVEFDGKFTREEAERKAFDAVIRNEFKE
jgi:hypothetical protein